MRVDLNESNETIEINADVLTCKVILAFIDRKVVIEPRLPSNLRTPLPDVRKIIIGLNKNSVSKEMILGLMSIIK